MNISNLFTIANAAKNIQAYDIANAAFAVLAKVAIESRGFCMNGKAEARRIAFLFEMEGDDLIESVSKPDSVGYYDLPALSMNGELLLGGMFEPHYLCIPLPLVSRLFCNQMLLNMRQDNNFSDLVDRRDHSRGFWRLSHDKERAEACYRDLWRRFRQEISQEEIDTACVLILRKEDPAQPICANEEEVQYLGPSTLAKFPEIFDYE